MKGVHLLEKESRDSRLRVVIRKLNIRDGIFLMCFEFLASRISN